MNDSNHGMTNKRSLKALMVVSCMLACALAPVVTLMDDDSVMGSEPDLVYVSLGDSMVNGCGMEEYYTVAGDNYYGFEVDTSTTYPSLLKSEMEANGATVDLRQLAISGIRSGELRNLLDPGFTGDYYTADELDEDNSYSHILKALEHYRILEDDDSLTLDDLRAYYADSIAIADIITYQFHWDFGNDIGKAALSVLSKEGYNAPEFDLYIDQGILDVVSSIRAGMTETIAAILTEQGIELGGYAGIIDAAEKLANTSLYSIIEYCSNFDANMEAIYALNPDAEVFVLDCYSNINGFKIASGDVTIPLDGIFQLILDTVNLYTKFLSPYSCMTHHVDIDGEISVFSDDFVNFEPEVSEIGGDAKYIFAKIFKNLGQTITYNDLICDDRTESFFFKEVFSTKTLDIASLKGISFGGITEKLTNTMTMFGVDNKTSANCTAAYDEDGNYVIDGYILDGMTPVKSSVSFTVGELGLLQVFFTMYQEGAAIAHPSAAGHKVLCAEVMEAFEELTNNGPVLGSQFALASQATPTGTYGTLMDLTDAFGESCANPQDIADNLGLQMSPVSLPDDARINDILYLLGGSDAVDAYTQGLLEAYAAENNVDINAIRDIFQDAVSKSSVVVVSAGANNIVSAIDRCMSILNGEDVDDLDFSEYESVDPAFITAVSGLRDSIDGFVTGLLGEGSQVAATIDDISKIVDTIAYETIGYTDNYADMVDAIKALNPDAEIIVVGPYNMLDGFVYTDANTGITLDIGAVAGFLIDGINSFNNNQIGTIEGVGYIDMRDAHQNDQVINLSEIQDPATLQQYMQLSDDEVASASSAVAGGFTDETYTVTFNVDGVEHELTYVFGAVIQTALSPSKAGYNFIGWDGTVPERMPASDLYFTALWEPIPEDGGDEGGLETIHYVAIGVVAIIIIALGAVMYMRRS